LRVGVIGAGNMGMNHLRVYSSMREECELVGVYDANPVRASEAAGLYGTTAFSRLEDLLAKVDAVSVVVPTPVHYEVGDLCLEHGVHMLMEKPITETVSQARKLIRKAERLGLRLQVGHIELFNPAIHVLKSILAGEEIISFDIHRMSPLEERNKYSDVVKDLMIHDIYMLMYLLGSHITKLYAVGRRYYDTVKHAQILLGFDNGVTAQLTASHVTEEKVRTWRVVTRKAFVQCDLLDRKVMISRSMSYYLKDASTGYRHQNIVEKVFIPAGEPLRLQLQSFVRSLGAGTPSGVSGQDGLLALKTADRIGHFLTPAVGRKGGTMDGKG
jgi:predicted dehydrogenase